MAKIDELIIQIKADTKQLQKDLKQIQGKIKVTGAAGGAAGMSNTSMRTTPLGLIVPRSRMRTLLPITSSDFP